MILEVNRSKAAILIGMVAVVGGAALAGLMGPEAAEGALRSAAGGGGAEGAGASPAGPVSQPAGGLHDPDRQRVLRAGFDLGRPAVHGRRRARRPRARVRRAGRRRRAAVQADRRVMRPAARRCALVVAAPAGARCRWRPAVFASPDAHAAIACRPGSRTRSTSACRARRTLIGEVFEFFFKTFFGIQAKVTQRTVEWLLAAPVYTDSRRLRRPQRAAREHRGRRVGAVHARLHGLRRPLLRLRVHLGGLL